MPKEARADLTSRKRRPQPRRVGRRQLETLDQEAVGLLGAHFRRLLDVRIHDLGERDGIDRILVNGINLRYHAPHHRPDDIRRQPGDAVADQQALGQRGLANPRSASHKVDDVRRHTGILL